jgi:hypothetical protein
MLLTGFRDALPLIALEPHPELEAWASGTSAPTAPPAELVHALATNPICSLVGRFDSNYFHWLVDVCGQLEGLRLYMRATSEQPAILIRAGAPAFARESLALLGFDSSLTVEWPLSWSPLARPSVDDLLVADVPRFLVSSWRGYRHGSSSQSLRWLRSVFVSATRGSAVSTRARVTTPDLKIYVQRPNDGWRAIANEEEVSDLLRAHGFLALRPEESPLSEQVALFSQASMVAGMHGAGLTNILFAPQAHLIELAGSYGGPEYFSMCHGLGNHYTRVQCADRGEDIRVDLSILSSVLLSTSRSAT